MHRLSEATSAVLVATGALFGAPAAPASSASTLATITLSSEAAHPGDTIAVTGTSFAVPRPSSGLTPAPVEIRWKSADGQVLATVTPGGDGMIATTFTIPESPPGTTVIVATQRRPVAPREGLDEPAVFIDEYGTPARATLRVLGPGERPPPIVTHARPATLRTDDGSTAVAVLLVLSGAVALSLFAGGVIAFLHQLRERRLTAEPWREW